MLAGAGALLVLAVVFGSVLAIVPLVMAVIAILVTFLAVLGVTTVTDVSFVVQFLVGLIGLGVAIDYALLITTRWREERAVGADNTEAIERTMVTAGTAVVFSGITVTIALAALILLPVPFLRSIGYGGLLIGLISVLVAITLLPVLLATAGSRLEWPRRRPIDAAGPPGAAGAPGAAGPPGAPGAAGPPGAAGAPAERRWGWHGWSRLVVRHPVPVVVAAGALLGALIVPVFDLRLGAPVPASIASSGPARQALDALGAAGIGAGVLSPDYVLTGPHPEAVTERARSVPGVRAAIAPDGDSWRRGGTSLVVVLFDDPAGSAAGQAARDGVRATLAGIPDARIGGVAAQGADFVAAVYGNAPLVLSMIALVTLLLLIRAFRSVLLAVKAVALNVLSVAATFGLTVLAWQHGYLSEPIWGIEATGALTEWVPVMVFGFLFGLSMDYEVFILARVREEYDATASTPLAAALGVARTGRLVTSGALILFLAFASLAATPGTEVKIFATALGLGILLDATVVRAMLVPALVVLFGRWNWWLPRNAARVLAMRIVDAKST
ncbi:MMPL family transporter [Actinoplanes sp. ATCC 53533]|uniref:MMPL family transporter n=1 Tax=Actinoplanes sp. ATCC 53533 TaxID=1288362 RepID=UPI0018F67F75|nr:MMPL family transporter [Actinoplanes sp. ATCC 53533]